AAVLQDGEVDVAVAQPDSIGAGIGGLPAQLFQPEDALVELGGLHRIVGRQRDVFDPCHYSFLSFARMSGARMATMPERSPLETITWTQLLARAAVVVKL